jgi:hypothetical protein
VCVDTGAHKLERKYLNTLETEVDLSLQVTSVALRPSLRPHMIPSLVQLYIRFSRAQEGFEVVALLDSTLALRAD